MINNKISNNNNLEDFDSGRDNDFGSIGYSGGNTVPAPVPEPGTFLLFGAGLAGLVAFRKKFKKA